MSVSSNGKENTIQAVVFDLDGVLMDSEWISFLVWREVAADAGGALKSEHYPTMIGLTAEETAEYVMQVSGASFDITATVDYVWREVTARISAGIAPLPGAEEILVELTRRGLPLAIASNSPTAYIHNALNGLRLGQYFKVIVGIDQVAEGKPAPDVYLRAAERLNVAPERCLALEDSLVGSQAAQAAGMRVLALPSKHDSRAKFSHCFGIYDSLVEVGEGLDVILAWYEKEKLAGSGQVTADSRQLTANS
jgi:HAD superfamily hydrolase (TIGR01509 family)